jgi:hypothetical protein
LIVTVRHINDSKKFDTDKNDKKNAIFPFPFNFVNNW